MAIEIFRFSGSLCDWTETDPTLSKAALGGKGAALVKMAQAGMNVPPGFTIPTDQCNLLAGLAGDEWQELFDELMAEVWHKMTWLDDQFGYLPLVSVRSGAPVSMPGMMDTILNVGLTASNLTEWGERIGVRAALDSQRRLIQMLGATGYGVPSEVFEFQLAKVKKAYSVAGEPMLSDSDLEPFMLAEVIEAYLEAFKANKGFDFPIDDAGGQLQVAIKAVFSSWMNERAIEYRKLNNIDEAMGTAVNIQAMVFGNMGDDSGTGVLFTRNPSTGENFIMGEFLQNAQGEDVVAGIRTPRPLDEMETIDAMWFDIAKEIGEVCEKLEEMYADMVDVEFTVQQGKLFILQSRSGKRSAAAAFRIAVELVDGGVIDTQTALKRITPDQYKVMSRPRIDPSFTVEPSYVGLPACPGVVTGVPVFSAIDAVNCTEPCIMVTHETTPDDIKGMNAAIGILTQTGGATSHAAVVARAMDKPCITGCTALDLSASWADVKKITIDGSTGRVWLNTDVPVIDSSADPYLEQVTAWCMVEMNAVPGAPVDLGVDGYEHAVQASYWWGDAEVADAVLHGIAQLPEPWRVTIDLRTPEELIQESDKGLIDCFGTATDKKFWTVLHGLLVIYAPQLQGVQLLPSIYEVTDQLEAIGYRVEPEVTIVPPAYAAFSVLSQ